MLGFFVYITDGFLNSFITRQSRSKGRYGPSRTADSLTMKVFSLMVSYEVSRSCLLTNSGNKGPHTNSLLFFLLCKRIDQTHCSALVCDMESSVFISLSILQFPGGSNFFLPSFYCLSVLPCFTFACNILNLSYAKTTRPLLSLRHP